GVRAPVLVGGAIPPQDVPALKALGVADVFGPGRPLDELARWVRIRDPARSAIVNQPLRFAGIMPANILPFTAELAIDEPAYRGHLRWLADARGVTGIVANGHAAEVSSLSRDERQRALAIALDEVGGRCPVIAGVYSDGTREAVELARDAKAAGAAGVLVFPPTLFMWGAQLKPEMVLRHFSEIAAGADLPIVVFEYPPASGIGYSAETLARLAEIPQVAAVKDWSNDIVAFERNLRALRGTGRPVAMLSSFTMSLMATFLLGADGAISGMGSVVADLQGELFEACQKGDLDGARRVNDRLDPLVRVFYAPPFVDMHNRMKEALVLLGRIPAAHVRPPLTPVPPAERETIRRALAAAGLEGRRAR
ncbi:MAG TPA: dihydrodipicolinate synthase family protein, partial [Methylomirabilota bacterium]|nr:dihydrodipicolinate synthase family protein [Methylomirabilota bacterium]